MRGERLGAYRIGSELGSGGMGTVYLATLEEAAHGLAPGDRVAIKVIHPHLLDTETSLERFRREGDLGRRVHHENIVAAYGVEAVPANGATLHVLVMEYVEGRTLRALLEDLGAVPEALLREIASKVAAGLQAIHDAGIVHRDLKPENILVTETHEVRIMDLGVAHLVDQSVALTRDGQFAGSLHYAAPEQFRGDEIGPAADLYALGVLLYELATGKNPFRHDLVAAVVKAHLSTDPPRLDRTAAEASPLLAELVGTLLAKDPSERFASAGELNETLVRGEESEWFRRREPALARRRGHHPAVPVRRETRVYGRDGELAVLRDAYARAGSGEGRMVLLEGEAGIGKSRLVDVFLGNLADDDIHVLYGSYPPSGGGGGLSDAVLRFFGAEDLEASLRPHFREVPTLVPPLAALLRREAPPIGSAHLEADALHAAFIQLLRGLSIEKPLVWVVEDLHFAEPESRGIVLSLARALSGLPVLLLGTTRPGIPEAELPNFSRLENFRRVELGRLSPREVVELLRDAFRNDVLADRLGAKIAYKSDGVPFFVFEMIQGLKEGSLIRETRDGYYVETGFIDQIEVPSAVRGLIEGRLREIGDDDRNYLDAAAVMGFEFDPDLVARIWETRRLVVLSRLASIQRRSGIIRAAGRRFQFDHHQIQEVVYEEIPAGLREEYHAGVADAYAEREAVDGGVDGEGANFLAGHHLRGNRPAAALPYLGPALDHLEQALRNEAARDLAGRALDREGLLVGEARLDLLLRHIAILRVLGRHPEQKTALEEAWKLADEAGDPIRRARAARAMGEYFEHVADVEEMIRWLERARQLSRDAGDRREEGFTAGALGVVCMRYERYPEALENARLGLEIARELEDRIQEARRTAVLGVVEWNVGKLAPGREHLARAVEIARETGDRDVELYTTARRGVIDFIEGRFTEARRDLRKVVPWSRERGDRRGLGVMTLNLAKCSHYLGDGAEALELYRRARVLAEEVDNRPDAAHAVTFSGILRLLLGDEPGASERFARSLAIYEEVGLVTYVGFALSRLADAALRAGRVEESLALHDRSIEIGNPLEVRRITGALLAKGTALSWLGRTGEAISTLEETLERTRPLDESDKTVLTLAHLCLLRGDDPAEARDAIEQYDARLSLPSRMEAEFVLWKATRHRPHLEAARRCLTHLREHAPEEFRESVVEAVPMHREIVAG